MKGDGWSRLFDIPIPAPGRRYPLRSLDDARAYMMRMKARDLQLEHWQIAGQAVLAAAEGHGPIMFAEIGMRKAISYGKQPPMQAPRKKRAKKYKVVT